MSKAIWLITSNQGAVGKATVAGGLIEWLLAQGEAVRVLDGAPQVSERVLRYRGRLPVAAYALDTPSGWAAMADAICLAPEAQVVIALDGALTPATLEQLARFHYLVSCYDWRCQVLFVVNTARDGLARLAQLLQRQRQLPVVVVKNLHFGPPSAFIHLNRAFAALSEQALLFPALAPGLMQLVRDSGLGFAAFAAQTGAAAGNFTYAKLSVADWRDLMLENCDDALGRLLDDTA